MFLVFVLGTWLCSGSLTTTGDPSENDTQILPAYLESEPLSKEDVYSHFKEGPQLRSAFVSALTSLIESIIEFVSSFPLLARPVDSPFCDTMKALNNFGRKLSRDDRKLIAELITESPTFDNWRRSTGFLSANLINHSHEMSDEDRNTGYEFIKVFVTFVKSWGLINTGYIGSKRLKVFEEAMSLIKDEISSGSGASNSSDEEYRSPHRPKACLICHNDRESGYTGISLQRLSELVGDQVQTLSFNKKYNCNKFYEHVEDLIHHFSDHGPSEEVIVRDFCTTSGENLLRYLSACVSTRGHSSTKLAIRFGNSCGTHLPLISRLTSIPSMMIMSLTPIEKERGVGFEDDEVPDEEG